MRADDAILRSPASKLCLVVFPRWLLEASSAFAL